MNSNGSGKRRITYFNHPGFSCYRGKKKAFVDFSWSPSGNRLVAHFHGLENILDAVLDDVEETIVMMDLGEGRGGQ